MQKIDNSQLIAFINQLFRCIFALFYVCIFKSTKIIFLISHMFYFCGKKPNVFHHFHLKVFKNASALRNFSKYKKFPFSKYRYVLRLLLITEYL